MGKFTTNLVGNKSCLGGSARELEERFNSPFPTQFIKVIYIRLVVKSRNKIVFDLIKSNVGQIFMKVIYLPDIQLNNSHIQHFPV